MKAYVYVPVSSPYHPKEYPSTIDSPSEAKFFLIVLPIVAIFGIIQIYKLVRAFKKTTRDRNESRRN